MRRLVGRYLETKEIEHTLAAKHAAIDIVAKEEIACLFRVAALLDNVDQVVVLAVEITENYEANYDKEERMTEKKRS